MQKRDRPMNSNEQEDIQTKCYLKGMKKIILMCNTKPLQNAIQDER